MLIILIIGILILSYPFRQDETRIKKLYYTFNNHLDAYIPQELAKSIKINYQTS